jgi:hypothetical protein
VPTASRQEEDCSFFGPFPWRGTEINHWRYGGIRFFLVCERPSVAIHACDKEEGADGTVVRDEIHRSTTDGGIYTGPLAVAGFVRRGEEM